METVSSLTSDMEIEDREKIIENMKIEKAQMKR